MRELELEELYSLEAVDEIGAVAPLLQDLFNEVGWEEVRDNLSETAASRTRYNRNSWSAALYRALADDERFVRMDWSL